MSPSKRGSKRSLPHEHVSKGDPNNAARERNRVRTLRDAFTQLQQTLPSIPPDTKLSKLDILILATAYIGQLTKSLQNENAGAWIQDINSCSRIKERKKLQKTLLHPVKERKGPRGAIKKLGSGRDSRPIKNEKWPMRSRLYDLPTITQNNNHQCSQQNVKTAAQLTTKYGGTKAKQLRMNDRRIAAPSCYKETDYYATPVKHEELDWLEQFTNTPNYSNNMKTARLILM